MIIEPIMDAFDPFEKPQSANSINGVVGRTGKKAPIKLRMNIAHPKAI